MISCHIHVALHRRKKIQFSEWLFHFLRNTFSGENFKTLSWKPLVNITCHLSNHELEGVAPHLAHKYDILPFLWMWDPLVECARALILQTLIFWCMLCLLSAYETRALPATPVRQLLSTGGCQDVVLSSLTVSSQLKLSSRTADFGNPIATCIFFISPVPLKSGFHCLLSLIHPWCVPDTPGQHLLPSIPDLTHNS